MSAPTAADRTRLVGRGVSPGTSIAPVVRMPAAVQLPPDQLLSDTGEQVDTAQQRLATAIAEVTEQLDRWAQSASGDRRAVLEATRAMACDSTLRRKAEQLVADGTSPETAIRKAAQSISQVLAGHGGLLAQRMRDVEDVRDRVLCALRGDEPPGVPHRPHPFVLVADDLSPADTATLDPEIVIGIVSRGGGPTSHTAILARSLGIPAVVAVQQAETLIDGTVVAVNGDHGVVWVDPPAHVVELAARTTGLRDTFDAPAITTDGHRVSLLGNVADAQQTTALRATTADGVGLLRTELSFLSRTTRPDVSEQAALYRGVLQALPGRKIVVRTLDAGADKPMPFLNTGTEPNPALGVRGYRLSQGDASLLDDQLAALSIAARESDADVWVMAPMISTPLEAHAFASAARRHGLSRVGVMIEVPAAALCATEILAECDFVSIGTNDLTQYTMAADREVAGVAHLNDPWQLAVLRLVRQVAEAGQTMDKPVGVCGEAAADPLLACVLTGMGVTSLSMTGNAMAAVANRLRTVSLAQCQVMARAVLRARTPDDARAAALRNVS